MPSVFLSGVPTKRVVSKRAVLADAPRYQNRNEGTFGCSPVPKTGMRVHAGLPQYQKPERGTFAKTALLRNHPLVFSRSFIWDTLFRKFWVRNRAGENKPGDIQRNHFVYTCVGTRVSTQVGAFVWDSNTEKANFCGHSRVHLREHSREHLREPFRGSIGGLYFAFASSVLH